MIIEQYLMGAAPQQGQAVSSRQGTLLLSLRLHTDELPALLAIVSQRSHFNHPHICTALRLQHAQDDTLFCDNYTLATIEYSPYDCLLASLKPNYPLPQLEIERVIFAVCSALQFLRGQKLAHGDISGRTICLAGGGWKLLDNYFIRNGISAYEKVLEGEEGFVSPAQMEKIRHGFVRESPPIEESDDIFALGMTCLELMTGRSSTLCYKQSYIRFNDKNFTEALSIASSRYPPQFSSLVSQMVSIAEQKRCGLLFLLGHPLIARHGGRMLSGPNI